MAVRVLLVDDVPEVRTMLRTALRIKRGIDVVGEAATSSSAARLATDLRPDVIVLDLALPDESHRDVYRRVQAAAPDAKVVIYSAHDSNVGWYQARGAMFVAKEANVNDVVDAIWQGG